MSGYEVLAWFAVGVLYAFRVALVVVLIAAIAMVAHNLHHVRHRH